MQKEATGRAPRVSRVCVCVCAALAQSAVKILKIFHEDFRDFLRILHQFLSVGIARRKWVEQAQMVKQELGQLRGRGRGRHVNGKATA